MNLIFVIAMCIGGVHLIQMAFHEVSFSSIENGFLFSAIGLVMAANQQFRHDLTPPQNRDAVAS